MVVVVWYLYVHLYVFIAVYMCIWWFCIQTTQIQIKTQHTPTTKPTTHTTQHNTTQHHNHRGADEAGLQGLARGLVRGLLGAMVRPLSSVLSTCAKLTDSIRRAVAGGSHLVTLERPPRFVGMCMWWLHEYVWCVCICVCICVVYVSWNVCVYVDHMILRK